MRTINYIFAIVLHRQLRKLNKLLPSPLTQPLMETIAMLLRSSIPQPKLGSRHPIYERLFEVALGDVVVDVGAGIGAFTHSVADRASMVVAIEPEPGNFTKLCRNIRGLKNVIAVRMAAWNRRETLTLHISLFHSSHSLFPNATERIKYKICRVEADTLDNIVSKYGIRKVDFIKINVEGAELEVLEGCKSILINCRMVVIDAHHKRGQEKTSPRVRRFLEDTGFSVISRNHTIYAS